MKRSDSRIVLSKLTKPVSFSALMTLYESNYLRLMSLLKTDRKSLNISEYVLKHPQHVVHCRIEDVTKYTTLVCIDEDQLAHGEPVRVNHFRVRLYHDALLAAVQSSSQHSSDYRLDAVPIDQKRIQQLWVQNMFLNKWLDYCADRKLVIDEKIRENTGS